MTARRQDDKKVRPRTHTNAVVPDCMQCQQRAIMIGEKRVNAGFDIGQILHPTADWIARQLTEALGWREVPRYLVRDRDSVSGIEFMRRIRAMAHSRPADLGARHGRMAMRRGLIGSIRRECLD
ncbi:MAG: hypothetical protein ACRECV_19800, partial [Xanthobacteraceae bacterium]